MRTLLHLAVLSFALATPLEAQNPDTADVFILPGLVLDYQTETPVPGALVEIPELHRQAFADAVDRFAFADLAEDSGCAVDNPASAPDVTSRWTERAGRDYVVVEAVGPGRTGCGHVPVSGA